MSKKRKKKEIVVAAPALRHREELLKDTIGAETIKVFKTSAKIGKGLSSLMIAIGTLLSLLSVYSILTAAQFLLSNPLFIGILGFLGVINIFCGLILLTKE